MRAAYSFLAYLSTPLLLMHLGWRSLGDPAYRRRIPERFGRGPVRLDETGIWVHAASVGEVQAAAPLVRALQQRYPRRPLVVTTMTPTGSRRAQELFGDRAIHSYLPFDLGSAVRRFFDWARPALAVVMETELWPNLYRECAARGVPLVLASARLSPRSARRYRYVRGLVRDTLSGGVVVAAQTDADAGRFRALGAAPRQIHVTGNVKFDFRLAPEVIQQGRALRAEQALDRPVWIAASTHAEEDQTVLVVHRHVLAAYPDALLILVPRHPERFGPVAALLERDAFAYVARSSGERCTAETRVFLGDSMGELPVLYAAADVAFVGGSLVPIGGHNLLEPAALGLPVVTGPYNFNAPDIAELLRAADAVQVAGESEELAERIVMLLGDAAERDRRGEAGHRAVAANRGALQRVLDLIEPLLAGESGPG